MRKALIMSSVASMIDQFNMANISLLQNTGYEVHVLANFKDAGTIPSEKAAALKQRLQEQDVKVYHVDMSRQPFSAANLDAAREVSRIFKAEEYDLIHCHSPIGGALARLGALPLRKQGTKIIYTAHGFHFFKGAPLKNWLIFYPLEKTLSRYTDCLITINEDDYGMAQSKKFKAGKIQLVNGIGVDMEKFYPPTDLEKKQLREQYGYTEDDFILIYVGELNHNKHQDLLINAMAEFTKTDPQAKLLLIGKGDYRDQYAAQIQELGLDGHIELLGYRTDVPDLMKLADVAVSASRREGLPVNVMEGMATGLPMVVTDCRGNRDLVKDSQNGFVVGIENPHDFAVKLELLYQSADLRKQFSETGLRMIQKYSQENIMQKMDAIYQTMGADASRMVAADKQALPAEGGN